MVLTAETLMWYTDSSGRIGFGGIRENNWFRNSWSKEFLKTKPSIEFLESYAVAVSVLLWVKDYSNSRICIFCDNESVVKMIKNTVSGCKLCMKLVRLIILECMQWNVRLFAKHVRS